MKSYLTEKEAEERELVRITKNVSKETKFRAVNPTLDYAGTIIDPAVQEKGGYIPIPEGFVFFNKFVVARKINKDSISIRSGIFKYLKDICPEATYTAGKDWCIYVPAGISSTFTTPTGVNVLTDTQRRYDDLVFSWLGIKEKELAGKKPDETDNVNWVFTYNRLIETVAGSLINKSGLFDAAVGCAWPFSMRGVITPDPKLRLNEIRLPFKVIVSWVKKPEFRAVYGIPEDMSVADAVHVMDGRRVLCGRQPSHDASNLLSFVLRTNDN